MLIGILGLGTIATAVVEGIAQDGHQITVSERSAANAARLAAEHGVTVAPNQAVVDASDVLIVALTDDIYEAALGGLTFREGQQVISLMGGPSIAAVQALVSPAHVVAKVLPFPSIAQGGSQVMACGEMALVTELLGARNSIFQIGSEEELHHWICAQAVLSPAVLMVREAAAWLAEQGAEPVESERFLRELVGSSLLASPCDATLRALDTPGGYNQRLRQHMVETGMTSRLMAGLVKLQQG
ncbi:NAD(P)-binding domain-containing protein [Donghicola mangrovi]|uniref:NAD(P)-binding domain-containing protein n=1 Tax=Donghicola mangrovi TaxID=2729614 RepID=A0A850Q4Q0_9RHOB|nr:NAD(P)-binding domain-containing protein [Donghicola mangrovi]NVO24687.1 NAD(P)-binding domain-containing protein [Donghicola mangrovi]